MTEIKREIRRILLGYISFSDNSIVAANGRFRMRLLGIFNGSSAARIFGVVRRARRYRYPESRIPADAACNEAFANLGRRILLESAPDLQAVFYAPFWYNPSVLTAELLEDDIFEISVYTAFSLTAWLNTAHALRRWKRFMPKELEELSMPKQIRKHLFAKKDENPDAPKKPPLWERVKTRLARKPEDDEE